MKILLVSHGSGPYGAERILLELARRLASRGHKVILSLPHPGPAAESAMDLHGVTLHVGDRRRLPRTVSEGFTYLLGGPVDALTVRRLVAHLTPDITWINSMYNPWAAIGTRLTRSPMVWHLHERSMGGATGALLSMIIALTANRAVAVSAYAANSFRHFPWLGRAVEVLHNPLLHEPAPPVKPPPGPFTIGYVGQLEPRKRATDLIRAIGLLPEDTRGIIVGDGKDRAALKAAIREVSVEHRVRLVGYRSDVPAQLARFHCLAVPSLEEAFGLAALEAMASGVPVIAARSGALPEVLGEAALYHEPESPSDLARQVNRLRGDPVLRGELGARGLERAARFRPEEWMESVEALIEQVASIDDPDRNGSRS